MNTIAATKTNLLRTKKSLDLTQEGYGLLDEKRRILISELNSIIHVMEKIQRNIDEALQKAYAVAHKAEVVAGRKKIEELTFSVNMKHEMSIGQRRVMGVSAPVITFHLKDNLPYYSPYKVSCYVDEVIVQFKEVLKQLAQLAEKKIAVLRLAKEAQKTIRKVNALEKVYIPYYRNTVKNISDRLDEESRESFTMLKLIRERIK